MLLASSPVFAQPNCTPSNRVATYNYPGKKAVHPTNNLLRPAGKPAEAEGQKLYITGQLLDRFCKPIPEARIELWQNTPYGRWRWPTGSDLVDPYAVFTGSGSTYTDEEGRFVFITAFPGELQYRAKKPERTVYRAPHINLRVTGERIPTFVSAFYFANDERNTRDGIYRSLSSKTKDDAILQMDEDAAGDLIGQVRIVLDVASPYRTY